MHTKGMDDTQEVAIPLELSESWADEAPAVNSLRYLIMRLVRLIGYVICEVSMLSSAVIFALGLFCCFGFVLTKAMGHEWTMAAIGARYYSIGLMCYHPFITASVSVAVAAASWGTMLNFGFEHRWRWSVPKAPTVLCANCQAEVADEFFCSQCHGGRIVSHSTVLIVDALNRLLTVAWIVHDCTIGVVCLLMR